MENIINTSENDKYYIIEHIDIGLFEWAFCEY